jgi:hypothetical protein
MRLASVVAGCGLQAYSLRLSCPSLVKVPLFEYGSTVSRGVGVSNTDLGHGTCSEAAYYHCHLVGGLEPEFAEQIYVQCKRELLVPDHLLNEMLS